MRASLANLDLARSLTAGFLPRICDIIWASSEKAMLNRQALHPRPLETRADLFAD